MTPTSAPFAPRPRGRPAKPPQDQLAREAMIRAGVIELTQKNFSSLRIETILSQTGLPKGSFYYHFASKAGFAQALVARYDAALTDKLARCFASTDLSPLAQLRRFTQEAEARMARDDFTRGCLVGNLAQEVTTLPDSLRAAVQSALMGWQDQTRDCLINATVAGELDRATDPAALAAFFWIGWEGAVMRARLAREASPLAQFSVMFFNLISKDCP